MQPKRKEMKKNPLWLLFFIRKHAKLQAILQFEEKYNTVLENSPKRLCKINRTNLNAKITNHLHLWAITKTNSVV